MVRMFIFVCFDFENSWLWFKHYSNQIQDCRLNRQSDPTSFEDKLLASVVSPYLTKAPVGHSQSAFAIMHYAGQVTYDVQGLIEKTKVWLLSLCVCVCVHLYGPTSGDNCVI